jgi:hypothetical protein
MLKISTLAIRVPAKTGQFSQGERTSVDAGILGAMATRASSTDILRMRLRTQRLDRASTAVAGAKGAVGVVRQLLAVQAQDFGQALWAVGARASGVGRSAMLAALESGEIVRSLPMRGTLHFVPAGDLGWMLGLTAERSLAAAASRFRALGLDEQTLDRAGELVIAALSGGGRVGRSEFMSLLESNGISTAGERGYHIIFYLAQRQILCWGPPSGTQQALVLTEEWVRNPRRLTRDEALHEFALRYFTGHGPATDRDFAWWTKLTLTDARAAIASAADELTELSFDDRSYWIATSEADAARGTRLGSRVLALPGFDEYLLGYQDRSLPLAPEHSARIVPGNNGIFLPLIVARGRGIGTWRRVSKSAEFSIEPEHFGDARESERAGFARASAAYAAFMRSSV